MVVLNEKPPLQTPSGVKRREHVTQGVVPHGGIHEEEDGSAEYGSVDAVNDINEM